jgi:hypothetical protein
VPESLDQALQPHPAFAVERVDLDVRNNMALFQPFTPVMLIAGMQPASHFLKISWGQMMIPFDQ